MSDLPKKLAGRFIVFDGPDGAGKSTQLFMLRDHLAGGGAQVHCVRDPGGTVVGDRIRQILLDRDSGGISPMCETMLFMASRAQLYSEIIKPALERQKCVLCDRWVSSIYAYQAVAGEAGADLVLQVAQTALPRTWPDLT